MITGLTRVRLSNLPSRPKVVPGVALECDIGADWPDSNDLAALAGLAWAFDRLIVVGGNTAAVAYVIAYLQQYAEEASKPLPTTTGPF